MPNGFTSIRTEINMFDSVIEFKAIKNLKAFFFNVNPFIFLLAITLFFEGILWKLLFKNDLSMFIFSQTMIFAFAFTYFFLFCHFICEGM